MHFIIASNITYQPTAVPSEPASDRHSDGPKFGREENEDMAYDREEYEATPLDHTAGEAEEQGKSAPETEKEEEPVVEAQTEESLSPEASGRDEAASEETSPPVGSESVVAPETVQASPGEQETPQPKSEAPSGQDDYSRTFRSLSEGDLVDGVVVHIDKDSVLVDVGTKSEGVIRLGELAQQPVESPEEVVSVGDRIDVYVMETDSQDGGLILSKKRADFERAWERVIEAFEQDRPITAMVTDRVRGGLVVDLGIRGFVPASHVGGGNVKNLDKYVGQSLPLKIIEVDKERRKVVLSHREAIENERQRRREETLKTLAEGQIRDGVVRRITDYGAFVDLGGVDGLLHVSEMSWTRIDHPSEVVKPGQKIQVMVLKLNLEQERISLGLRQILPDPWASIESRYRIGDIVHGKVSRLVPFGAFVRLEEGIEGIIPNAELSQKRVKRAEDVVNVGDEVEARVIDLNPEERRMTLSIRQAHEEKEKAEFETYRGSGRDDGRTTLGDLIGDKLKEYRDLVAAEKSEEPTFKSGRRRRKKARKSERHLDEHEELDMIEEPVEEIEVAGEPEAKEEVGETAPAAGEVVAEETQEIKNTQVVGAAQEDSNVGTQMTGEGTDLSASETKGEGQPELAEDSEGLP